MTIKMTCEYRETILRRLALSRSPVRIGDLFDRSALSRSNERDTGVSSTMTAGGGEDTAEVKIVR